MTRPAAIPTIPFGFGGLEPSLGDYRRARAVVVPLPYDNTTSYRTGTREGPAAIIAASRNMEQFDEELRCTPAEVGIATLDPLEPDARGPEQTVERIERHCRKPLRDGKFLVALGGEHTVTVGCLRALHRQDKRPFTVLQIDAHADLRDRYQDSPYSHACVMRRAREFCPAVQVGIRSFSEEEHRFMVRRRLELFTMDRIRKTSDWMDRVVGELLERVYVTIDLDGLDPAFCPGVGTPEPGGLSWPDLLELLRKVFSRRQVIGADVVECLPLPGNPISEFLAARLAYKLIGYRYKLRPRP